MAKEDKAKKPKVAKAKKDQKAAELVLSLGVEGSGVGIYRTPLTSGGWQFHVDGSGMRNVVDDNGAMEEVSDYSTSKPVKTIQEALRSIAEDGSLVYWLPISIHPEYRYAVWELVQEVIRNLPDERKRWWAERTGRKWQRLLRQKVSLETSPKQEKNSKVAKEPKATKNKTLTPKRVGLFDTEPSKPSPFGGRWRITSMEMWSQDVVDAEVQGFVEFGPDGSGSFQFAYVSGDIDYRDGTRHGKPSVEWSWDGNDEMDPAKGSGWAVIDGDKIHGVIAIHHADHSKFEAIRKEQTSSKKRSIKEPVGKAEKPKLFHARSPALASSRENVSESVKTSSMTFRKTCPRKLSRRSSKLPTCASSGSSRTATPHPLTSGTTSRSMSG